MRKKIKLYEFTANMMSTFFTNCKGEIPYHEPVINDHLKRPQNDRKNLYGEFEFFSAEDSMK